MAACVMDSLCGGVGSVRYLGGLSDDHQQVPHRPCLMEGSVGIGIEIGIRKGPPKTDGIVSSVYSGVHGVSI